MAVKYLKDGEDFSNAHFSKDFGFTGSTQGRHDARNHPQALSDDNGPEKYARGGAKRGKPKGYAMGGPQQPGQPQPAPPPGMMPQPMSTRPPMAPAAGARPPGMAKGGVKRKRFDVGGQVPGAAQGMAATRPQTPVTGQATPVVGPQTMGQPYPGMPGALTSPPAGTVPTAVAPPTTIPTSTAANAAKGAYQMGAMQGARAAAQRIAAVRRPQPQRPITPALAKGGGFLKKAVKHPGRMKNLAARHGVSLGDEIAHDQHSSDPSLRSAANLGARFRGGDLSGKRKG
jgi:hypothetical protein